MILRPESPTAYLVQPFPFSVPEFGEAFELIAEDRGAEWSDSVFKGLGSVAFWLWLILLPAGMAIEWAISGTISRRWLGVAAVVAGYSALHLWAVRDGGGRGPSRWQLALQEDQKSVVLRTLINGRVAREDAASLASCTVSVHPVAMHVFETGSPRRMHALVLSAPGWKFAMACESETVDLTRQALKLPKPLRDRFRPSGPPLELRGNWNLTARAGRTTGLS